MTNSPHTAPARPVEQALEAEQIAAAIRIRWASLVGPAQDDGFGLGWRRADLCHQFGLAVLKELAPLLAELASLRAQRDEAVRERDEAQAELHRTWLGECAALTFRQERDAAEAALAAEREARAEEVERLRAALAMAAPLLDHVAGQGLVVTGLSGKQTDALEVLEAVAAALGVEIGMSEWLDLILTGEPPARAAITTTTETAE